MGPGPDTRNGIKKDIPNGGNLLRFCLLSYLVY